jgi:VanZ family protein
MFRPRNFLLYWLPVMVWMVVIFTASADKASFQHSASVVEPFLRWLFPHVSFRTIHIAVVLARKCAHLTEYAILALLVWRAFRKPTPGDERPWRWFGAMEALWVAMFYAATDEFHQTFVPSREGCLRDVLIDSCGALIGLILLWALGRWRKRW